MYIYIRIYTHTTQYIHMYKHTYLHIHIIHRPTSYCSDLQEKPALFLRDLFPFPPGPDMKRRSSTLKPHCFSKVSFWGFKLSPWPGPGRLAPLSWWFPPNDLTHFWSTKTMEHHRKTSNNWKSGSSNWIMLGSIHKNHRWFPETTICIQLLWGKSSVPEIIIHWHVLQDSCSRRIPLANIMLGRWKNHVETLWSRFWLCPTWRTPHAGLNHVEPMELGHRVVFAQPSIICCENQNLVILILRALCHSNDSCEKKNKCPGTTQ